MMILSHCFLMKRLFDRSIVMLGAELFSGAVLLVAQAPPPSWAYGYLTPLAPGQSAPKCADARPISCAYPASAVPDGGPLLDLPGTAAKFHLAQIAADYGPADWYPNDHPQMPDIVAHGREADGLRACGLCHFPNGKGKMENGGVAGLSAGYMLKQLADFKNGLRRSWDPRKANTNEMAAIAKSLSESEAKAAVEYFSSLKWTPWVKVVESETAPKVRATTNGLFLPLASGETEALGQRIIEVPENPERTDKYRDPHSGFIAYVPVGSLVKGESLVTTGVDLGVDAKAAGNRKTMACGACHGADLKGKGDVPAIAGRSPSYTIRQLWDMQQGTRNGAGAKLMKGVVAKLSVEDMIAITAYVSSREP
jgi:cytochrome c553